MTRLRGLRHRPSTIDRLDPALREQINRLRIDKGYTIDQIVDHMKTMDVTLSRSALGRHVKTLEDKVGDKIRELRIAAEAVGKKLDGTDDGRVGALNRELAHAIIMRTSTAQNDDGDDVAFSPQEAMFIAKALDHLAKAEKTDTDRLLKEREAATKQALKEVGKELKKAGQPGLSKELADNIFDRVMKGS